MWFIFHPDYVIWIFAAGVVGFVWLCYKGVRGRKVDSLLYCKSCKYCLLGLSEPENCAECGADLSIEKSVFTGLSVSRKSFFVYAFLWMGLMMLWGIGGQSIENKNKLLSWLMWEIERHVADEAGGIDEENDMYDQLRYANAYRDAWQEIFVRVAAKKLSDTELNEVVDMAKLAFFKNYKPVVTSAIQSTLGVDYRQYWLNDIQNVPRLIQRFSKDEIEEMDYIMGGGRLETE